MPLLIEIPDRPWYRTKERLYHFLYHRSNRIKIIGRQYLDFRRKNCTFTGDLHGGGRAQGNEIIDSYRDALEKVLQDHKVEAQRQSEIRIKTETINAKQQINQSLAKAQLDLKREQSKIQQDLKDKIFKETLELVHDYMKSADYPDFLIRCIRDALTFANGSSMTIYINPSDESLKSSLEEATGTQLTISTEDFIGGVRCVIRDRNILIDHSFKTQLRDEYDKFLFSGGDGIA